MLLHVPNVLTPDQVTQCRAVVDVGGWADGSATAGHIAAQVKRNDQLPETGDAARQAGEMVRRAVLAHPLFVAAALPHQLYPPMFNSYGPGQTFGNHIDNAMRVSPLDGSRIRTDLSCTLFLTDPDDYDGGELVVEDTFGAHGVKLAAGDLILYPATSLHRVEPVTRGARVSSFFWIQSLVRDIEKRRLLFELDTSIQRLTIADAQNPVVTDLSGIYHNLLRQWAEV
ncbi:Fe2+-dependent dioxygenase [Puniceibacterium sp. IMCC21224]|uniref:Fe2+-dependent dioxygenase n=1 Tax=Puniceibacterium sp. IMCC21224 TaxID=1618204 RepID=UPI00064D83EB|nr:Fe2+-dependent dioxygenase [Puniceibacterium sp. IMCC21224]KMK66997.1 putative iron-regulated protein [Puniceibacterium sp. IMCC21224]